MMSQPDNRNSRERFIISVLFESDEYKKPKSRTSVFYRACLCHVPPTLLNPSPHHPVSHRKPGVTLHQEVQQL
jgi:hypothetical protein